MTQIGPSRPDRNEIATWSAILGNDRVLGILKKSVFDERLNQIFGWFYLNYLNVWLEIITVCPLQISTHADHAPMKRIYTTNYLLEAGQRAPLTS